MSGFYSAAVTKDERQKFVEDILAPLNLRRILWLVIAFLPIKLALLILNLTSIHGGKVSSWMYADVVFSLIFLAMAMFVLRLRDRFRYKHALVLAFYVYLLLSMDEYYFSGLRELGSTPAFVLGMLMAGVLFPLPPPQFFLILGGNYLLFVAGVLSFDPEPTVLWVALIAASYALILACLASWFQFQREWWNNQTREIVAAANQELLDTNAQLRERNREMNEIMAIAAHDLRSPLTTLNGFSEELRGDSEWQKPPYDEVLTDFSKLSGDMLRLVGRLLDAHASEHQAERLTPTNVELGAVTRGAVARAQLAAAAKSIELVALIPAPVNLATDSSAVEQALDNLLSNAVKFSSAGSPVTLTVGTTEGVGWVDVADEGPGIDPEDQAQLFRKFHRGKNRPTANEPSTGLGLFIVEHLVEALGGSVAYRANLPKGSIFRLSLPK